MRDPRATSDYRPYKPRSLVRYRWCVYNNIIGKCLSVRTALVHYSGFRGCPLLGSRRCIASIATGSSWYLASEPRPSPFMRSVISRACAECNCVWANSAINGWQERGNKKWEIRNEEMEKLCRSASIVRQAPY